MHVQYQENKLIFTQHYMMSLFTYIRHLSFANIYIYHKGTTKWDFVPHKGVVYYKM